MAKPVSKYGFDLTDFGSPERARQVLLENSLRGFRRVSYRSPAGTRNYRYEAKNKNVRFIVGNNPITGQYSYPRMRPNEKGYASYVGIEGQPRAVKRLVSSVKRHARSIKDESPGERNFI